MSFNITNYFEINEKDLSNIRPSTYPFLQNKKRTIEMERVLDPEKRAGKNKEIVDGARSLASIFPFVGTSVHQRKSC